MERNKNIKIIARKVSDSELDEMYGDRKIAVGKCFRSNLNHIYKQLKDGVLHLNTESDKVYLANILHVGFLNDSTIHKFEEIDPKIFNDKLSEVILKLSESLN